MNKTIHTTRTISGSGSAHNGGLMGFGRRLILRAPEGDPAGGSGGAPAPAPEGGNPAPTPAPTPAATAGAKPAFTAEQQAEVNRIAAAAREEGRKSAHKEKPPTPAPQPTPAPTGESSGGDEGKLSMKALSARLEESELRRSFDKRAAKTNLSDDAADDLFDLYKVQRPGDPAAWFEAKQDRFGFKPISQAVPAAPASAPVTPTATPAAPTAPVPPAPPAAAPSAPSGHGLPMQNGVTDIFSMTDAQRAQLGPTGIRKVLEQLEQIGNTAAGIPQRPKPPSQR